MDNVRLVMDSLKEGWRWLDDGIYFCEDWRADDIASGETATQRTAKELRKMMNSIIHFLNLTIEIQDDFPDLKLPTLDLKIWVEKEKILYEHYEKPMKTNLVLEQKSALSENTKVSSLSQEVVR